MFYFFVHLRFLCTIMAFRKSSSYNLVWVQFHNSMRSICYIHQIHEYVIMSCVVLLKCINLEVNNVYSYVKELSHICHGVKHSCYRVLYKKVKLHLSHMYYWDVIFPYLLVYNRGKRDP
jgi:hypothetical protein